MLLYTKVLQEEQGPVRKVYGTLNNIPAESDKEVTLMDAEGTEFEAVANDTYLDNGHGGIVRASDKKAVNVIVDCVSVICEKVEKIFVKKAATKVEKVEEPAEEVTE